MFSVEQKRNIANAVQKILRDTGHSELPVGEIQFKLYVHGRFQWSWADIQNNGAVPIPSVNPWNEAQDKGTPPESRYGREPDKAGVMQVCDNCVFQNKAVVGNCCSPVVCKHVPDKVECETCETCGGSGDIFNEGWPKNKLPSYDPRATKGFYTPCPNCQSQEPDKVKPLAQYLGEYIEYEMIDNADCDTWIALLEQALDAYESTKSVKMRIEKI
ncbi:hypothetical protein KAR91_78650 [Candidatus Pacearchaeota archaeon]|nr:hypothetical protein [Candidatus Pacearchaeota archaeon]